MKPKILIIYTGGTIGMIENQATGALEPFDFNHLMDNVPKVKMLDYEIQNIQFEHPLDSSDMTPEHWSEIARSIERNYEKFDGFVVLHGTDTMAYTASALSFMLENLHKPVIITGSQLPIGEVRTDGEENLITALQIAAERAENGQPLVQEVAILFENYLWRGNRATKMSADNFNAFKSNNYPSLAKIGLGIHYNVDALMHHRAMRPLQVRCKMCSNVMFIDLHPGLQESTLRHLLATPDIKGVVLRTFGAGNGPSAPWFINALRESCQRGLVILNVSQCVNGGVHPKRYLGASLLEKVGVVPGYDITAEAAITKLMYLFGVGLQPDEVKQYLVYPLAGEITVE